MKKCDLSNILKDTVEAYYWVGFILADGCLSKKNSLKISLSSKDKCHLEKLQKFLNIENISEKTTNKGYGYVSIGGMDTKVVKTFCEKFKTGPNKTYFPPDIEWIENDNLMLAMIAGIIDGDGYIGKQSNRLDFNLRIKCHRSWLPILKNINDFIYKEESFNSVEPKLTTEGYALLSISNTVVLKNLKRKVKNLKIPLLNRKWNIIDMEYVGKYEDSQQIKKKVLKMVSEGKRNKEICQVLKIKPSRVSNIIKRNSDSFGM